MFNLFTNDAKESMGQARMAAQRWGHDYIGVEHILIGMVQVRPRAEWDLLLRCRIDREAVARTVEAGLIRGDASVTHGALPFTPRAKNVLELTYEEARSLGHQFLGLEHLFLGQLRSDATPAARALRDAGLELDAARRAVEEIAGDKIAQAEFVPPGSARLFGIDADELDPILAPRHVQVIDGIADVVIAYRPERDPQWMFEIGLTCGRGLPVVLLHDPGEAPVIRQATPIERGANLARDLGNYLDQFRIT